MTDSSSKTGLVVVWDRVRVFLGDGDKRKSKVLERGADVPQLDDSQRATLVNAGAIAGALIESAVEAASSSSSSSSSSSEPEPFDPAVGGTVPDTLEYVGDDKGKAAAMLELEQGKAKPRPSLVEKLEAVVNA